MTNPVTPNIGLNKIDRTSPSTTYFDLEKYIDQNADAVDRFAGESSDAIGALEKRLDTEERREVVLQPGLQIVNAERSAPFKLSGIKGRTLVNLLGRAGACNSLNGIFPYQVTLALDNSQYTQGTALKVTVTQGFSSGAAFFPSVKFYANKKYVLIVNARVENAEYARIHLSGVGAIGNNVTSTTFKPSVAFYSPTADTTSNTDLALKGSGSSAIIAYFDAARIYEVSAEEYAALASMTPEQVADKYPYVDSVQPVRNPYAIRYGENLAPTLFEGVLESSTKVLSKYSALIKATGATVVEYRSKLIPAKPNTKYTIRAKITHNGIEKYDGVYVDVLGYDESGLYVFDGIGTDIHGFDAFHTPANIKSMEVRIVSPTSAAIGEYVVEDIMLNIGTEAQPFKPRKDSMLALQTDLFADPSTGANADEVFEKDGQYFKLTKWGKATLTDNFNYVGVSGVGAGWKQTYFDLPSKTAGPYSEIVVKHDGKVLQSIQITDGPDIGAIDSGNPKRCYISFSNADTGWGDNYTPTTEEIKAYFMGWKMYLGGQADVSQPYNGTGSKAWCPLDSMYSSGSLTYATHFTSTLPMASTTTLSYSRYTQWTPYKLVYQLATPTIEPIVSEGMLTFNEGDNQIEVGSGMLIRESVVPQRTGDAHVINDINLPGSILRHKVERFLNVYKNGYRDQWEYRSNVAYGSERRVKYDGYDITAAYSVTYLMLDKSPFVPFSGSYAVNEKSILQELTGAVHQNATAVTVLMNKKQDKDAPGWITPTLLNGWGLSGLGFGVRVVDNNLQFRGALSSNLPIAGTVAILPMEMRPTISTTIGTVSFDPSNTPAHCIIDILTNGSVNIILNNPNKTVVFEGVSLPLK